MQMIDKLMPQRGVLLVISGPSGSGKNTLVSKIINAHPSIQYSVSVTTREPRSYEKDGVNYHFVKEKEFKKMIDNDELLEWARVYNNYYGTPRKVIEKSLANGKNVIMDLDIQGAEIVQKKMKEGIFVFLLPPSFSELKRRLDKRGSDSKESLKVRMANVKKELMAVSNYDYLIVNNNIECACSQLEAILTAETQKVFRWDLPNLIDAFVSPLVKEG